MISTDQALQFLAWFLALAEFILALYILLLNAWHTANRHASALFLLFAINTLGVGLMIGAKTAIQAILPTLLLAATVPSIAPGLLLLTVALLKPDWLRGRWRRAWWPIYMLCLLPLILTGVDVKWGTRLYYTGLNAESYDGGFVFLTEYAGGVLFPAFRMGFFAMLAATLTPLLYVALRDKEATSQTRQLAWLLLGTYVAATVIEIGLLERLGKMAATLITNALYILAYAYAAFQQMISERRLQRGRLQTRLTALVLATTVPILVAVVTLVSSQTEALILQKDTDRLHTINSSLAFNVEGWLDVNVLALEKLIAQPDIISLDAQRQEPLLQAMAVTHPYMYLVSTTDLSGVNVARSDDVAPKDYHDRPWFFQARDGVPLTFQTLVGRTSGEPALVASMPIRDKSGGIVGVGMFASDLTDIGDQVQASTVGETGFSYVVDAHNQVLAHPDPVFSAELHDLSPYPPIVALRQGARGLINFQDDQGRRWQAFVDELSNGWGIVVQQQETELLSGVRQFQHISWTVMGVGVATLLVLTWLTIRQAFQPIGALTDTVTAITAGDLTRVAPVESEDEIGAFARAFNSMTEQLCDLIGNLEKRVADRTHDLETLYRIGQVVNSTLDTGAILDQLTDEAMRVTRATHGQVLVVREERGCFERRSQRGFSPKELERARSAPLPLDRGINSRAYATRQAVCVHDVQAEPSYFPLISATRTELAVPIIREGQVLGNLDLQSPEPGAFRDVDLDYLNALADQVAIALDNSRIFRAMERGKRDWETTFDAMQDAIALVDRNQRVRRANQAFANLVHRTFSQTVGQTVHTLLEEASCSQTDCPLEQTMDNGQPATCIHKYDGRVFETQTTPLWEEEVGKPTQVSQMVYVMRDITEQVRAQATLQTYTTKLEHSNRELEQFAYVASHDLQEPLRKVTAFGDRLKARYADALDERGLDYLGRMQNAAARMQNLINALLTYSRVTTQAQPFEPVDLTQVARDVVSDLEMRVEQVGGQVQLDDLPTIEADPTQMRQLLQNLISNALKFHRDDLPPRVQVRAQRLNDGGVERCQIAVQDNGIGFDEQYLDRIFQVFQRLHGRGEYEGSGLGLATCRKITERHGGTIAACSTPGQGATFIVTLPVKQVNRESGL